MTPLPVPYRTNPSPFKIGAGSYVFNAYVEEGADDQKANFMLLPCAGMKTFGSELSGPNRGMIYVEDEDRIYSVQGIQVYSIESDGTATSLGLVGGTNQTRIARNDSDPQQIGILAGGQVSFIENGVLSVKKYSFEQTDGSFETITPVDIAYCGGRFVFPLENGRFYWTNILGNEINALNFATAEGDPDGLVAAHGEIDVLYLFGPKTTEIWGLVADQDQPFQRIGGGHLLFGTQSKHTVKSFNNAVAVVGADNVVYLVRGTQYEPFSSNEVSKLIEADPDKENLVAFTHERGENKFYTLQGTGWTREYNAKTDTWANRSDLNQEFWHCLNSASAWNKKIFGDSASGQLFEADYTIYTDNSEEMEWGFITNVTHNAPDGLSFEKLAIDMQTGGHGSYGSEGFLMVSWSDDNLVSWKPERRLSLGQKGEGWKRVKTNRLGRTGEKGRAFRVTITDPVIRAVAGLYADVKGVEL